MERAGKVGCMVTAVVLLCHWNKAGQANQEQEEELEGQGRPEDSEEEGLTSGRRGGGGGGEEVTGEVRRGGSEASACWRLGQSEGRKREEFHIVGVGGINTHIHTHTKFFL